MSEAATTGIVVFYGLIIISWVIITAFSIHSKLHRMDLKIERLQRVAAMVESKIGRSQGGLR